MSAPANPANARITLAHGGGGKAMQSLIEQIFASKFNTPCAEDQARLTDKALNLPGARLAFTTDSYVVSPVEFPGGDIGTLAVCGTVNDLAVGGARPLWLSAAFILEEGCEISLLERVVRSMQEQADKAGVSIVTGDTKVVERGSADTLFITTAGVGVIPPDRDLSSKHIRAGDIAIVNGNLGNHAATILTARGDMSLSAEIVSDCAGLGHLMEAVLTAAPGTRAAKDATRGGLASALNEMAGAAGCSIEIDEDKLPLRSDVKGVCEILGFDPLYLANEGTLVLFTPADQADAALAAMRSQETGQHATIIGRAVNGHAGQVVMRTTFNTARIVDRLVGEQLPRIC